MSLQFIIGGSGSGKTRTLYENLIHQSMEEPDGRFFALVPEQFTMQTQKEIVMLHPNHGVMNIDIVSFERLAYRVFEELAIENLAVLDDMGKSMVLRRVSSGVRGNLHLFGGHLDKAGFISEIKSMLSEFFQYGITEEKLETLIGETKSPLLRQKLLDMQVLYRAFQAYTEEKVIVKEEILSLLCRVLPQSQLIRDSVVTLDGYTGFTPIQYELLELLFRCCRKVIVTVTMDPEDNPYRESVQQKLFYMSRHTVCRLIDRAAAAGCSRDEDILLKEKPMWRFKDSPELGFIENELFRYRGKVYHSGSGNESGAAAEHGRESLRLIEAATPQAEISFLCGEIRRLVASEGIRYREIAVITGDLETYSREILRQFEKNQIPCFIDYKKNILSNPMVELIRAALEVLQSGFSYESVFRFLKTGLVMPLAGLSPEVIYQAENYVIALGIRGFKRWNSTWERVYRGAELINLDELNQFREAVVTPFLPLREVFSNRKVTVRERTEALVHFLEALEMEQKLAAMAQQFEEVGDMSLAKEYGFIDYKKNILSNPMVELIRAALEVLQSGFSYESVFRFLKTGLVMPLAGLSPEVIYQAENYVIALGIRGFKRWNSTWERVYRGAELINLDELNQFREAVVTPFLPLREVFSNRKVTVRERTEALVHFLEALEMEQKLAAMAQQFEEVGDMSLAKEYGQVYGLVMDLFDRIVALLGEEVMGQREYAEILDAGFAEIKVGLIPAVVDRIVVGDITRTRLSNIKVLFFAGVNDGIVPSVSGRGGILSEADRRALREMQVELAPTAREESFLQRFYLYLALTKPSDYLYLSCAASSAEGKAMRPSSLMLQLLKLFPEKRLEQPEEEKEALWSPELGMSWVLRGLQDEKSGENDQFISLYRYFIQAESYRDEMQALSDAAFYTYQDTGIGKAAARALYSPILRGSVTRMELYASCAYAHFLSYGLELSERQMYEIAPSDIGNLFHAAIDMYFTRMKEENRLFSGISEEDRQKMVAECVASVTEEYGNAILGSSYRNQYLERKVYRITDRTIWALTEQLKKGDFEPAGFEVSFSPMDHLRAMRIPLSNEEAIHLRGRIDRIDLCEDGDRLYLKIIDYKTGKTKFDLTDIYYGLQLQLVVYMDAAMEKIGREYPDKTVVPAGLFYYHIEDPMVERKPVESEEETNADILKALRMNGLVNGDREALAHLDNRLGEEATVDSDVVPVSIKNEAIVERRSQAAGEEKFRVLGAYVNRKMKHMGREILDGNIAASPYKNGQKTACDYCPYHSVCGFDLKTDGYQFRRFDKLSPEEIWGKMEEKDKETEG